MATAAAPQPTASASEIAVNSSCGENTRTAARIPAKRANCSRKFLNPEKNIQNAVDAFLEGREFGWARRHYGLSDRQLERGLRAAYEIEHRAHLACAAYLEAVGPAEYVDYRDEYQDMQAEVWADVQAPLLKEPRNWRKWAAAGAGVAALVVALHPDMRVWALGLLLPAARMAPRYARLALKAAPKVARVVAREWHTIGNVALGFARRGRRAEA